MRTHEWTPCELYQAYEAARDEAELALAHWSTVPHHARREAFTVYRAAADRENAAAFGWLRACITYDDAHASVVGAAA